MAKIMDPARWEEEVAAIEARYGSGAYPKGRIIFYGSSSIRLWDTLERDMAPLPVLRHGVGGAFVDDMLWYLDRLITPFEPSAVVFYCGTNDMGTDRPEYRKTAEEALNATVEFFDRMAGTPVYYIASTPNLFRWDLWPEMERCNDLVREYCEKHDRLHYIDTVPELLNADGSCREELFRQDRLHLNPQGYEVWTNVIRPVLLRDFEH